MNVISWLGMDVSTTLLTSRNSYLNNSKTYLYEDGRSCALEFKDLNDIQNFIMYMVTIGREFENGYEIIFPNDQDTVDKYNEILAEEQ